jgi:hypothetical protein
VVRRAVATATATTAGWLAARATGRPGRASTVALTSLVGTQLAQTAMTARDDPVVLAAVAGSAAALVGLVQSPLTSPFFGCRPVGPVAWGITLGASAGGAALAGLLPDIASRLPDIASRLPDVASHLAPVSRSGQGPASRTDLPRALGSGLAPVVRSGLASVSGLLERLTERLQQPVVAQLGQLMPQAEQ